MRDMIHFRLVRRKRLYASVHGKEEAEKEVKKEQHLEEQLKGDELVMSLGRETDKRGDEMGWEAD